MKELHSYIVEKLKIDKDSELEFDENSVGYVMYHVNPYSEYFNISDDTNDDNLEYVRLIAKNGKSYKLLENYLGEQLEYDPKENFISIGKTDGGEWFAALYYISAESGDFNEDLDFTDTYDKLEDVIKEMCKKLKIEYKPVK